MQTSILTRHLYFARAIQSIYPVLSYDTCQLWANLLMSEGFVNYIHWQSHDALPPRAIMDWYSVIAFKDNCWNIILEKGIHSICEEVMDTMINCSLCTPHVGTEPPKPGDVKIVDYMKLFLYR